MSKFYWKVWHANARPVALEELAEVCAGRVMQYIVSGKSIVRESTVEDVLAYWGSYGEKLDGYVLLPTLTWPYSAAGVRFGDNAPDYLSIYPTNDEKMQALIRKIQAEDQPNPPPEKHTGVF